jgi:cysteine desulfurase / selenocysteine lyase
MLTDATIEELRADTPGANSVCHFNVAGAGLMSRATIDAVNEQLLLEATVGSMEAGVMAATKLQEARRLVARLLNASSEEIYFQPSGSAAWGSAFAALPAWSAGDRVLVSRQEWGSNLTMIERKAATCGAIVEVMPCKEDGSVDVQALRARMDDRVRLIALTWLPANGGLINDAAGVGAIARTANVPYFIDAGQAVGQLPVDVRALQCDVLKTAGRKHLRGPRGTALLYVRSGFLPSLTPAYTDVQALAFEMHEQPMAMIAGLHCALALAQELGVTNTWLRVQQLAELVRRELAAVPNVQLQDIGTQHSGLISFTTSRLKPMELKEALAKEHINIGANGIAYTPLDMRARQLDAIARVSISYLNTENDIHRLIAVLRRHA